MSDHPSAEKLVDADYVIALFGVGEELSRSDIEVLIARIATLEMLAGTRVTTPPPAPRFNVGDRVEWTNLLKNAFTGSVLRVDSEPRYLVKFSDGTTGHFVESEFRLANEPADPTKWTGPTHTCVDNKIHIGAKDRCSRCSAVETNGGRS